MKKIAKKTEYFLDIPQQISTTGHSPSRGFYTYIEFVNGENLWIDSKGNEISGDYCIEQLNFFRD